MCGCDERRSAGLVRECVFALVFLSAAAKFKDDTNGKSAREFQIKLGPGRASHVYNELSMAEFTCRIEGSTRSIHALFISLCAHFI